MLHFLYNSFPKLRNVFWLVSKRKIKDVLLGRPFMKELGLEAVEHLGAVSDNYQNMDCSMVG